MKAVIPAAGSGTRFLPVTKNSPKEMLPLIDRPSIQYVVEEAVQSGCDDILIVTGRGKRAVEDHFDRAVELELLLEKNGEHEALRQVREIANLADIHFVRQKEPLGLGHAVLCARKHVDNEPFVVLLGDEIMFSDVPCTRQILDQFERTSSSVIAVGEVPRERTSSYGIVAPGARDGRIIEVRDLVEKPPVHEAPSTLGILGRYVLTPRIFDAIERTPPGRKGEMQLTDAIRMLSAHERVLAYEYYGQRFDLGNKMDWLKANVEVALMRKEFGAEFRAFLHKISQEDQP